MTARELHHARQEQDRGELEAQNLIRFGVRFPWVEPAQPKTYHAPDFTKPTGWGHLLAPFKTRAMLDAEDEAAYRLKYPTP